MELELPASLIAESWILRGSLCRELDSHIVGAPRTSRISAAPYCAFAPGRDKPPIPLVCDHSSATSTLLEHEVLETVNELDGDGSCVHRCPRTKPPMSFKLMLALVGEPMQRHDTSAISSYRNARGMNLEGLR